MSNTAFYITPRCNKESQQYDLSIQLMRKVKELEAGNGALEEYGSFSGSYFRIRRNNFRIVGVTRDVIIDGEQVKCNIFLRVLKRGTNEYSKFQDSKATERRRESIVGLGDIDWKDVERELLQQRAVPANPVVEKESLSDHEQAFLNDNLITHEIFDTPIYESVDWIQAVRREGFDDWFKVAEALENHIYQS